VTERKPPGVTFSSWIDQQISEATSRGVFDNLPGLGKPLPPQATNPEAWAYEYALREGVPAEDLLPTPLKLRRESAKLAEAVGEMQSERQVRDAVAELNERIMKWRRLPIGPPIFVRLVDEEAMVELWRIGRTSGAHAEYQADVRPRAEDAGPARRARWRRRRSR